jgi:hypothetical protein
MKDNGQKTGQKGFCGLKPLPPGSACRSLSSPLRDWSRAQSSAWRIAGASFVSVFLSGVIGYLSTWLLALVWYRSRAPRT